MRKAVIFDLDGTLVDSLPDIAFSMNDVLRDAGLPEHALADYRHMTGNGARTLTERAIGENKDALERVYAAYRASYALHCAERTAPYPGICDMLHVLAARGIRLCVLSNKDDADAHGVIARYFPDVAFAIVRGRMPGVPLKPAPDAVYAMLSELGLSINEAWYVGDTPTDMLCAQNAGLDALAVTWGYSDVPELTAARHFALCDTPRALADIIASAP